MNRVSKPRAWDFWGKQRADAGFWYNTPLKMHLSYVSW